MSSFLKRFTSLSRSALKRKTPIKAVNPERQAKRRKKYKAYLSSAAWKQLRLAVFERDGFRCTAEVPYAWTTSDEATDDYNRCPHGDKMRKGVGLVCDHLTYARFGHELLEDLRTLCTSCNAKSTKSERANWMDSRRWSYNNQHKEQ